MTPYIMNKADITKVNQGLKDCELICQDLDRAEAAGIPNIQYLKDACDKCKEALIKLKSTYAANSR